MFPACNLRQPRAVLLAGARQYEAAASLLPNPSAGITAIPAALAGTLCWQDEHAHKMACCQAFTVIVGPCQTLVPEVKLLEAASSWVCIGWLATLQHQPKPPKLAVVQAVKAQH